MMRRKPVVMRVSDTIVARSCSPMGGSGLAVTGLFCPAIVHTRGSFATQFGPNYAIWASVVKKREQGPYRGDNFQFVGRIR
jgi:hypothetical protein